MWLTCICCKILEHIVCHHVRKHLDDYNILTPLQHAFRKRHSCESQLWLISQDITAMVDRNNQVDVAILDFSKAFDTVPHEGLLKKLDHYGIRGNTHQWITAFLRNSKQCVVVNVETSSDADVESGVPQGIVLGPLLFLCHMNDLPDRVKSTVRMFADDCLIYRKIKSRADHIQLQHDLLALPCLQEWVDSWGMRFNAKKCYILRICRPCVHKQFTYQLMGQALRHVDKNPYLGFYPGRHILTTSVGKRTTP